MTTTSEPGVQEFELPEPEDTLDFPKPDHTASKPRLLGGLAGNRRKTSATKPKKKVPPRRKGQFVDPLEALYGAVGAMLMPIDPVCGQAIVENAEQCAISLDELAYQNDAVRRVLIALTQTSAVGVVLIAHMPILMSVFAHHGPGRVPDTVPQDWAAPDPNTRVDREAPEDIR